MLISKKTFRDTATNKTIEQKKKNKFTTWASSLEGQTQTIVSMSGPEDGVRDRPGSLPDISKVHFDDSVSASCLLTFRPDSGSFPFEQFD